MKQLVIWSVFTSLVLASPAYASEPVVAFVANGGFLELALKQDGKPIEAIVELRDEKGVPSLGETYMGEALIPLPAGDSFIIELKTGERTADPIRLYRTPTGVEPSRVQLSYGLRPCCRSKLQREPIIAGAPDPMPVMDEAGWWDLPIGVVIAVWVWLTAVVSLSFFVVRRFAFRRSNYG